MRGISEFIRRIGTENAFAIGPQVEEARRIALERGIKFYSLTLGEPSEDIPPVFEDAIIESLRNKETHYSSPSGIKEFKEVIAEYQSRSRFIDIKPESIIPTPGGKTVICFTILSVISRGDKVFIPSPAYPIYDSMVNAARGKVIPIPLDPNTHELDLDLMRKKIDKKTKLIIINSPSNPTGCLISGKQLSEIAILALENDCWVLSDEIYSRIVYECDDLKQFTHFDGNKYFIAPSISSFDGMKDRTIILDGSSKIHAATGVRLGYAVAPKSITGNLQSSFTTLATNFYSCLPVFNLRGSIAAHLKAQKDEEKLREGFKHKRDLIVEGLNSIDGIFCANPKGAFYVYPDVTRLCKRLNVDAEGLRTKLLNESFVACTSQIHFPPYLKKDKRKFIRFSYACSEETIAGAVERMKSL